MGVGVRALQGLSHFENDGLLVGVPALAAWAVVAAAVLYWRDSHLPRRRAAA